MTEREEGRRRVTGGYERGREKKGAQAFTFGNKADEKKAYMLVPKKGPRTVFRPE